MNGPTIQSWGKRFDRYQRYDHRHAYKSYCPRCDKILKDLFKNNTGHPMVGFEASIPSGAESERPTAKYIGIFECLDKGKLFWLHVSNTIVLCMHIKEEWPPDQSE